jgi:hypothetical protein
MAISWSFWYHRVGTRGHIPEETCYETTAVPESSDRIDESEL